MLTKLKNEDLGYDDFFESNRRELRLENLSVARVMSEHKELYEVINENGKFWAKITGKKIFNASSREDYPAVGDWVLISESNQDQAVIHNILSRKTILRRVHGDKNRAGNKTDVQIIGTNIDVAFIVESVDRDYSLNRFERYFAMNKEQGIKSVIILNKIDLISKEDLDLMIFQIKKRFGDIDIILTNTINSQGIDELRFNIKKGKTYCFLGSSGVGKSSLINKLIEEDIIKTGEISEYTGRGKHTTTNRKMYFLKNKGIVIDNPGIREVGMTDIHDGLNDVFDKITELGKNCKYKDCSHTNEPGCVVIKAIEEGFLDKDKYDNYINLKKETEYCEMSKFEKRKKDRDFGKFVKNIKKDLRKNKF